MGNESAEESTAENSEGSLSRPTENKDVSAPGTSGSAMAEVASHPRPLLRLPSREGTMPFGPEGYAGRSRAATLNLMPDHDHDGGRSPMRPHVRAASQDLSQAPAP